MKKLAYFKLMGLVKCAAKPLVIPITSKLRQLGNLFSNYSALRGMAINGASPDSLKQTLKNLSSHVDISPFTYRLSNAPSTATQIARDAFKQARVSLSDFKPLQIRNLRKPDQLLGHLFTFQNKPTMLFNSIQVPSPQSMQAESLWSAVNAAMSRFFGKSYRLPVNSQGSSSYITYKDFPGVNLPWLAEIVAARKAGQTIKYKMLDQKIGNAIRYAHHFNPDKKIPFHNFVAPIRDAEGIAVYNGPQTMRKLYDMKLLPKKVYTVNQPLSSQLLEAAKRRLTDNFGELQGGQMFEKLISGKGKLPQLF